MFVIVNQSKLDYKICARIRHNDYLKHTRQYSVITIIIIITNVLETDGIVHVRAV